ncbi:IGF-like family receptor 1 isoform X1 [Seriola aureovittata]|uniref:IGF-like family receptor 1 isoform X1 n=1 Tax=Seriola aureovittata TaxID=2871759 RepID=UPI0024BEBE23|nr:IGF-like family receptor 1 isoform X1 [Seriola aureovittata]XP_056236106.1 IGF-like family receptor 1 isoform X1 [Seriola aureovittata]XP_056236107.1 IGF-like family receptor 1 isoform X1 [Seriola aureovittata]
MHSIKCLDVKTRWDKRVAKCVPCPLKPGYEITPNCGFDDNGGRHEVPHKKCKVNTFNDGSWFYCRPCTVCQPYAVLKPCSQTTDTECQDNREQTTEVPVKEAITSLHVSLPTFQTNQGSSNPDAEMISTTLNRQSIETASSSLLWAVPLAVLISIILVVSSAFMIYMKRKRGQHTALVYRRRSSFISERFPPLHAPACNDDLKDILSSEILLAPLQTVLDNLDVLEQLVILLDPDSPTVKNTKHLASHCSFSSTWITYSYSMKDSKSPLKALLEGVTSRYPDWTVGHLAKLLRQMQRNDAIAVLAQLRLNEMAI